MQILNSIISACSFLLLLFSIHLFFANQGNRLLNRLLSIVVFARFGHIVIYSLITSDQAAVFPVFQKIFIPFYYLAPACLYLYITGFIDDRTNFRKIEWLHFVPAVFAVIHVLPWHLSVPIEWDAVAKQILANKQLFLTERNGLFPPYFYYIGRPLLIFGYLFATWKAVLNSRIIEEKGWHMNKTWVFFCLMAATVSNIVGLSPLFASHVNSSSVFQSWFLMINCFLLLFVVVFVFHQPRILYGYLLVAVKWEAKEISGLNTNIVNAEVIEQPEISIPKNNLLPDQLLAYTTAMKEFMETERPFLLPDFQIIHLAQKLNIPVHHCSFVINNIIGKNFRDWINAYRIHDFIKEYPILSGKMTIEAIAYKAGFKSVATFYNAFKKETGLLPKIYFSQKKDELSI